jgi:hypothetical protein
MAPLVISKNLMSVMNGSAAGLREDENLVKQAKRKEKRLTKFQTAPRGQASWLQPNAGDV